eukprot:1184908-Prorocentrum_minimum.AAC.4
MDQLMSANQLTLAMVAAFPALALIGLVGTFLFKSFQSPVIRPSSLTLRLRMSLYKPDVASSSPHRLKPPSVGSPTDRPPRSGGVEVERALLAAGNVEDMEKLGILLYQVRRGSGGGPEGVERGSGGGRKGSEGDRSGWLLTVAVCTLLLIKSVSEHRSPVPHAQLNLMYRAGQNLFKINPYLHILPSGATEWGHLK